MRNAWVTCPGEGNNPPKGELIPYTLDFFWKVKESWAEGLALVEGLMSYQLVGRVTAYQGNDG